MGKADNVHRAIAKALDFVIVVVLAKALPSIVGILAAGLYILISDGFFKGQSIGKKLVHLRVISLSPQAHGRSCSFRESLIRNIPCAVLIILGPIPIIGWFIILPIGVVFLMVEAYFIYADDQGIRIGDIFAETQVVDDPPMSKS